MVLRAIYENNLRNEFEVVAVNASGDLATNAHLTQFDTVHGRFNAQVSHDEKSLVDQWRCDSVLLHPQPRRTAVGRAGVDWCWNAPAPSPARPNARPTSPPAPRRC